MQNRRPSMSEQKIKELSDRVRSMEKVRMENRALQAKVRELLSENKRLADVILRKDNG